MKRKASKELLKTAEEEAEVASIVVPIIPNGDLQLDFTKDLAQPIGLLVNRNILCIASPIFKAMLGDDSRFRDTTPKTMNADGIEVIPLEDDDYATMEILMNIVHLQGHKVPSTVSFLRLDLCARLCDKYDLGRSLGGWPEIWMKAYLPIVEIEGYERWLFISLIFRQSSAFATITRCLVLNTTLSDTGELLCRGSSSFSEGVSGSVIEWISTARANSVCALLTYCWDEMSRLRGRTACGLRNDPRTLDDECEACETINLGLLSRQFPDIREPARATTPDPRSIIEIHKAIIRTRHLQNMAGIAYGFAKIHEACDVGSIIKPKALAYVNAVRGRELDPIISRVMFPIWAAEAVARLQNTYPDARLIFRMGEIYRSTFTENIIQWDPTRDPSPDTVILPSPQVLCMDCSSWSLLKMNDMGNGMEEHLKTDGHRDRVERRLSGGDNDRPS